MIAGLRGDTDDRRTRSEDLLLACERKPNHMIRNFLILVALVAMPLVVLLMVPGGWEQRLEAWVRDTHSSGWLTALIAGLLAADIFLPTPSSVLATLAGAKLGVEWGSMTTWCGMTLGALVGFVAARCGGSLLLRNEKSKESLRAQELLSAYGPLALAISRPIPLLAEAMVLLAGFYRMSWGRFLAPVALANLALSIGYAILGKSAEEKQWLPMALLLAAVVPLFIPVLLRIGHGLRGDSGDN